MAAVVNRDFFELVKAIGESKSKQEEDRIVAEEVAFLKKSMPQVGTAKKKQKELVIRALYVEMLGQDASFAYIKAVELCAATGISQKKAGYLAASLFLSPDHEFRFMLVNQIQRDMKSTNMLEISTALVSVIKLVTEDMIPAVIGDVLNLLNHDMEVVRKKAVSAIHRFYQMDKKSVLDHVDKIRRALCDRDPSVMGATLPLFQALVQDDPLQFKDLVPSFVSILKQIIEHRLPREFDYHRIPAPWIQMNLIKILALLGKGDQVASEGIYEVLAEVMKRADSGINVGYAVVYECVKAAITIYPNSLLIDASATAISRFIRSDSHNLKYIGIKGLASIVKDNPRYAADHQLAVIDCLEDPDETLKRKTLELLYKMTNAVNVEFIVEKLLSFLSTSVDDHFRSDLVNQISQCAERFAPSNAWYVQTIIRVFELAGDKVKQSVAQTLTQLIAEGAQAEEDDEDLANEADDELRKEAVDNFLSLLDKSKLPSILAQTMAWVLGEYGYLSSQYTKEDIMDKLCKLLHGPTDSESKAAIVTALSKLVAQNGSCPAKVLQAINFYSQSRSLDLQQRCLEVLALLRNPSIMADILPVDASCEDIEVDEGLSFLNDFVQKALNYGAKPYAVPISMLEDLDDDSGDKKKHLKITPYASPTLPAAPASGTLAPGMNPSSPAPANGAGVSSVGPTPLGPALTNQQAQPLSIATAQGNQLLNNRGASQVWGKKPEPPPPAPVPTPVASPAPTLPAHSAPDNVSSPAPTLQNLGGMWGSSPNSTVPPQPTTAAAPPVPPAPKVLTEKEKMAAALFGGVGGSGMGSKQSSIRRKSTSESAPTTSSTVSSPAYTAPEVTFNPSTPVHTNPSKEPVAAVSDSMDLLGLSSPSMPFTPPPAVPTSPPPPIPPSSSIQSHAISLDDFELGLGMDVLSTPPPPVPTAAINLLSPTMTMPPPVPPAPVSAMSNSNVISDVFGDLDLSKTSMLAAPSSEYSMAPLVINTGEFGKRWGTLKADLKQSIPCGHLSKLDLESIRKAIPSVYHLVESIPTTQEAIYASNVTSMGSIVLLHCKINVPRRSCDIIVKSSSPDLAQKEAQHIQNALSTFRG